MPKASPATVRLFRIATLFTVLAVAMGSVVCATDSGFECSTWPGCYPGRTLPGESDIAALLYQNPVIEITHRVSAIVAGPLVLACALVVLRRSDLSRLTRGLPWLGVAGAVAAGAFGRAVVLGGIPTWAGAIDLFCALGAMAAMTVATVRLERGDARFVSNPVAAAAAGSVALLVTMHLVGLFTAGPGSYTRCMSWPVWQLVAADGSMTLQVTRWVLAIAAIAAILVAGRRASLVPGLTVHAVASVGLLATVLALGVVIMATHVLPGIGVAYSLATVALLFHQVLFATRAALTDPTAARPRGTRERVDA